MTETEWLRVRRGLPPRPPPRRKPAPTGPPSDLSFGRLFGTAVIASGLVIVLAVAVSALGACGSVALAAVGLGAFLTAVRPPNPGGRS